jgi:hypothetical protein
MTQTARAEDTLGARIVDDDRLAETEWLVHRDVEELPDRLRRAACTAETT